MRFNPKTVHFGGHESFQLRYSWLTKGYRYVSEDSDFLKRKLSSNFRCGNEYGTIY